MNRGSCARTVAARGVKAMAASASMSSALTQRRHYEYWGMWTNPRANPDTAGQELPKMHDLRGHAEHNIDAQFLTGNGANIALTQEMLSDRVAENQAMRLHGRKTYNGMDKWVVDPVNTDEVAVSLGIFEKIDTEKWFSRLFHMFPNLTIPLDEAARAEMIEFYGKAIAAAEDEAAVTELARPYLRKMFSDKTISPSYWWRISECLMDEMEAFHREHALRTGRERGVRNLRLVVERLTKISLNTLNDWSFASEDFTHPFLTDPGTNRITHEAGMW